MNKLAMIENHMNNNNIDSEQTSLDMFKNHMSCNNEYPIDSEQV